MIAHSDFVISHSCNIRHSCGIHHHAFLPKTSLLAPRCAPFVRPGPGRRRHAASRKTILVLGDSLSAGFGVDPDQAWPALLQKKIDAAGLKFTVLNAGVSGDTTADGLQRVDWLLRRRADVLLLELGGNDGLRGVPVASTRQLQAVLDRVRQKYPAIKLVIAGMKMPPNMGVEYVDAFNKIFPSLRRRTTPH